MNLIPESNGLHRVNMREKLSILQWVKKVSIVLAIVLLCGFIFQSLSNFIGNEQVRQRLNYVKIDDIPLDELYLEITTQSSDHRFGIELDKLKT